eukprot:12403551-Karenia_brevis.AAC.2
MTPCVIIEHTTKHGAKILWEATKSIPEHDLMFLLFETRRIFKKCSISKDEVNTVLQLFPEGVHIFFALVKVQKWLMRHDSLSRHSSHEYLGLLHELAKRILEVNQEQCRMVGVQAP